MERLQVRKGYLEANEHNTKANGAPSCCLLLHCKFWRVAMGRHPALVLAIHRYQHEENYRTLCIMVCFDFVPQVGYPATPYFWLLVAACCVDIVRFGGLVASAQTLET